MQRCNSEGTQESGKPGSSGSFQMAPVASMTVFAKQGINFNHRNLASQTIQLDIAIQQWELLVLDLILSGLRKLVINRKGFLKPSHMVVLCFLICSRPGYLGPEHVLLYCSLSNRLRGSHPALVFVYFIFLGFFFFFVFSFQLFIYFLSPNQCMHVVGGKKKKKRKYK